MLKRSSPVPVDMKIKLYEEFFKEGGRLTGSTVYKGYPLGQWGITLRRPEGQKNLTEKQYQAFKEMGVLDRLKGKAIEAEINELIEWHTKYPYIDFCSSEISEDNLKKISTLVEEQKRIQQEYQRLRKYYQYIKVRMDNGKLTNEQIKKLRNANINAKLGFSNKTEILVQRYRTKKERYKLYM